MATKKKLEAEEGKAAATVIDETAAATEQRLKDVEDYATRIDDALGGVVERVEKLEAGGTVTAALEPINKRLDVLEAADSAATQENLKSLSERVAKVERNAVVTAQSIVHPSADNPPSGQDSMGLPKVVD